MKIECDLDCIVTTNNGPTPGVYTTACTDGSNVSNSSIVAWPCHVAKGCMSAGCCAMEHVPHITTIDHKSMHQAHLQADSCFECVNDCRSRCQVVHVSQQTCLAEALFELCYRQMS